jgi:hypothetical protein
MGSIVLPSELSRLSAAARSVFPIQSSKKFYRDFADCSALAQPLSGQDAALFCLGVYTGTVPDEEFRKITVDYTVEFAHVLRASSPSAAFSFLSGSASGSAGADYDLGGGLCLQCVGGRDRAQR